jgi:hypothetical protein
LSAELPDRDNVEIYFETGSRVKCHFQPSQGVFSLWQMIRLHTGHLCPTLLASLNTLRQLENRGAKPTDNQEKNFLPGASGQCKFSFKHTAKNTDLPRVSDRIDRNRPAAENRHL